MKTVLVIGGHPTPALAVVEELKGRGGWKIIYLGERFMEGMGKSSFEREAVAAAGAEFLPFSSGRIQTRLTRYTLLSLLRVPVAVVRALVLLRQLQPNVVVSFGGYLSTPVLVAARVWGIPSLTHDQTLVGDRANRINQWLVNKVAVGFPQAAGVLGGEKVVVTGNPVRRSFFEAEKPRWLERMMKLNLPLVVVTGGSQGSVSVNKLVGEILPRLLERYVVVHQTGRFDLNKFLLVKQHLERKYQERYLPLAEVTYDEMGAVLRAADLVVGRAGANTVTELSLLGRPAVLIPLPIAHHGEQLLNAKWLADLGLAEVVRQEGATGEKLWQVIDEVTRNKKRFKLRQEELPRQWDKKGAWRLANLVEELAR